jgi:hypothetical protein
MIRLLLAAGLLLLAAACHENPQHAVKPYAGKVDAQPYDGTLFNGDKDKFEKALAARAQSQNEYLRTGDGPSIRKETP